MDKEDRMQVSEIMQYSVLTATPEMSLALAWRLMADHRLRHLPVLSDGRLIGLVSDRDIRSASPATNALHTQPEITIYMGTTPIQSCMTRDVITVSPEAEIGQATQKMLDGRFGCLPVLAQERLVGILTDIDLLRGYLAGSLAVNKSLIVADAMQDFLILLTPEDLVSTAYRRMQGGIVRHLPIVDEAGKLVG
jgi:CBS domain-containing protein